MKKIIVDKGEGIAEVIDRILNEPDGEVSVVIPKGSALGRSVSNFHLLKREADSAGRSTSSNRWTRRFWRSRKRAASRQVIRYGKASGEPAVFPISFRGTMRSWIMRTKKDKAFQKENAPIIASRRGKKGETDTKAEEVMDADEDSEEEEMEEKHEGSRSPLL